MHKSFFEKFTVENVLKLWNESDALSEIAIKLGYNSKTGLKRIDYEYISSILNRENWLLYINQNKKRQRERYKIIGHLSKKELFLTIQLNQIETLGHLSIHYLVSPKHGRSVLRQSIKKFNFKLNDKLYKSVYFVSKTPFNWPKQYYEQRVGKKPSICSCCGFNAINSKQIELHHINQNNIGPKKKRNKIYFTSNELQPLCANCHSLKHRNGKRLIKLCGQWRNKLPGNQKYKNPDLIFSKNCLETYRLQKIYYLKWYLKDSKQYKCSNCNVSYWGPEKQILSLELHHKDKNHFNSLISNLKLLCPNCHRNE